jgi:hypothetical protein
MDPKQAKHGRKVRALRTYRGREVLNETLGAQLLEFWAQPRVEEITRQGDESTRNAAETTEVAEGTGPSSKGEIVGNLGPNGAKDPGGVLVPKGAGEPKGALRAKGQGARVKPEVVFCKPEVYAHHGESGHRTGPNPNPLGPRAAGVTGPQGPTD